MEPLVSSSCTALLLLLLLLAPIDLVFSDLEQPPPPLSMGAVAAQGNQLTVGSSIKPSTTPILTSSDGTFAFGFCNYNLKSPQLLLAIWFDFRASNCSSKAVVWFARYRYHAVTATKSSVLSFDDRKGLSLMEGPVPLWSPRQAFGATTLRLLETGNLQLVDARGDVKWQSFDDPTHALLPGQNLTSLKNGKFLLSKTTDTDFSVGWFNLVVQDDCNIVLYMRDPEDPAEPIQDLNDYSSPYWASGTWMEPENGSSCTPPIVTLDDSGTLYYFGNMSGKHNMTAINPATAVGGGDDYYYYTALDHDGTVRVYNLSKKNTAQGWAVLSQFPPDDGCTRHTNFGLQGICGPNSYCAVSPSSQQQDRDTLSCLCATEVHEYIDEQHPNRGCRPSFVPDSCDGSGQDRSTEFVMVEVQDVAWSNQSTYKIYPSTSAAKRQHCNVSCLSDCFCTAVLINESSCMLVGMLTEGRRLISDGGGGAGDTNMTALIKVPLPGGPPPAATAGRSRHRISLSGTWLYITIVAAVAASMASLSCNVFQYYCHGARSRSISGGLRSFTYKELCRATNDFKVILGEGGFGVVWKGELTCLQPPHVAVKKLIKSKENGGRDDFENEVRSIGQIHHKNLVRMIGYCNQRLHRMLVFEYMQGGTLASFIFGAEARPCWSRLAEAAIGIARGLEYLHEGCKSVIVHCDIKPDNILFDGRHVAKITDFGISRLLGDQTTQQVIVTNTIAGTRPYIAPEWFDADAEVGSKVDVYSFGVVLLEMICCRRATTTGDHQPPDAGQAPSSMFPLRAWVERLVRAGNVELLVQGETEALADMESVERFARIAIWCLQRDPSARPTMRRVVQMLEGDVEVEPLPEPPRALSFSQLLHSGSDIHHSGSSLRY